MTVNERINQFIKNINSNPTALSNKIGVSQTSMASTVKGGNLPSAKILIPLKENYPDLNMNWVLVGQGEMYLSDTKEIEERVIQKDKMIEILEESLKDLKYTVQLQKKNLAEKDKQIKKLQELTA